MVLPKLLLHYCRAKSLRKILVIWNDVESQIPQDILNLANKCQVSLEFIREKENRLTNRFKPRPEIETECKLLTVNLKYASKQSLTIDYIIYALTRCGHYYICRTDSCDRDQNLDQAYYWAAIA